MKNSTITKIISIALIVMTFASIFTSTASAASWRTGRFDSGYTARGYTTVRLSDTRKNGYIKIYTYDMSGRSSSGKMHITLRTTGGKWLCEFDTSSGTRLKLGNDHSAYRVYIAVKRYPNSVKGQGDDFINIGKCVNWGINCVSNCYI